MYNGLPSTSRWILPRYSPISARMNPWNPSTASRTTPPNSGPGKFEWSIQNTTPYVPSATADAVQISPSPIPMSWIGCAFNAYRRDVVVPMLGAIGKQKFTKALVLSCGASVVEVDVDHAARADPSRYSPLRLTRLALHVLAGFWPQPIQWIGLLMGFVCTLAAFVLGIYGVIYWISNANFPGPLFGGTLILFVLGIQGFILALVGEYLGRIQRDVEGRPLYTIEKEL